MKKLLFVLFLAITVNAYSAPPTRQVDYTSGTTIRSDDVESNEDEIFGYLQTGVDTIRADGVDTITEIKSSLKSGSDATLVTGTKGATTGQIGYWDANGDLIGTGTGHVWDATNNRFSTALQSTGVVVTTTFKNTSLTSCDTIDTDAYGVFSCGSDAGAGGGMSTFIMEDGDGTEISISDAEEMKFVEGTGIDINWTDTSPGSDGDPFDLTVTFDGEMNELSDVNSSTATAGMFLVANGTDFDSVRTIEVDNAAVVPLTIKGATSQSASNFLIENSAGTDLFQVRSSGSLYNNDGLTTSAVQYGSGIFVYDYGETTPEHTNTSGSYDHTGGTYEKLFTNTAGDDFTQADADTGNHIVMMGTNIGAIAEIKEYIDGDNVVISGYGWDGDFAAQSYFIVKHPIAIIADGSQHEFMVNSTGEFEVQSYQFTGSKVMKIENDIATDSSDTLHIDHNSNGYSNTDAIQILYETGDLQTGDENQVIQISLDESGATDGSVDLLYLETTDAVAGVEKDAIHVSVGFDTALTVSGATADDMDYGYVYDPGSSPSAKVVGDDSFINTADDEELLSANGDFILIGNDATFEILEIILATPSSKDLELEFYYSDNTNGTDTGVVGWTQFYPDDGTQGMTQSGLIDWASPGAAWDEDDLAEAGEAITEGYYIAIKRTRVGDPPTDAVEDIMQIYLSQSTGMNIDGLGVVQLPYLGGLPTGGEVNGKIWMEADGVHVYYAGSEATLGAAGAGMTSFVMEDDDGTEISISNSEEMKFVEGAGISIDWTDTTPGSDADPFDLTITFDGELNELSDVNSSTITAGNLLVANGTDFDSVAMSGDVTMVGTGAVSIGNEKIDSDMYVDASIDLAHMSSASVDSDNIVDSTIVVADTSITAGRSLTWSTNDMVADAELYTLTKCAIIETPTDADNFMIYHVELGAQITRVHCVVEDATSATIEIEQCDVAGDNCTVVTTALVCDVGGQEDDGTIDNPDLDVDDWVRLDVTATSGTPGAVTACFTMTMDD